MKTEILSWCDHVVNGLLNGVVQGTAVVIVVALALKFLSKTNAATRYAVWFATIVLLAVLMGANCLRDKFGVDSPVIQNSQPVAAVHELSAPDADPMVRPQATDLESRRSGDSIASTTLTIPERYSTELRSATDKGAFRTTQLLRIWPDPSVSSMAEESGLTPVTVATSKAKTLPPLAHTLLEMAGTSAEADKTEENDGVISFTDRITERFRLLTQKFSNSVACKISFGSHLSPRLNIILLAAWLVTAVVKGSMLSLRLYQIRRLKSQAAPPAPDLAASFHYLASELQVRRPVQIKVFQAEQSPILLGFFHPVVLMPAGACTEAVEPVLRHELAHVRRYDDWANLAQHIVQAVFFFHPGIWWVSKQLSLEREIACDDQVIDKTIRPGAYASILAELACRMRQRMALLTPGISINKSQLQQRIDMILNTKRNSSPRLAKMRLGIIACSATLLAITTVYAAPRLIVAGSQTPPADEAPSAPEPENNDVSIVQVAPVADATPAPFALPPGDADGAPRYKTSLPLALTVRPGVVTPDVPVPPGATAIPAVPPVAGFAPMPPRPRLATGPRMAMTRTLSPDASLEQRLEHLERLVETLIDQQNRKGETPKFGARAGTPGNPFAQLELQQDMERKQAELQKRMAELEHRKAEINPKEMAKIKEMAESQAKMAADQAKRAAKEIEKAMKAEARLDSDKRMKDGSQRELEGLRRHHEALEREMERLDRQIEKLEQNEDQQDDEINLDDSESEDEAPKAAENCPDKKPVEANQ